MIRAFLIAVITAAATFTGISAQPASAMPCWTSFNPPAPGGAPMTQTYLNCNPFAVSVINVSRDAGGQIFAGNNCRYVYADTFTSWNYHITNINTNYYTALCLAGAATGAPGAANAPCFTTFAPGAPNGGPMTQHYRNCNGSTYAVAPAYTDASGQITVLTDLCQYVEPGASWKWNFQSTAVGVNYSTAICQI